jgi:hypothetical protein
MVLTKQEINKRYYLKNKEKVREIINKWDEKNKEYLTEIRRKHSKIQSEGRKNLRLLNVLPIGLINDI